MATTNLITTGFNSITGWTGVFSDITSVDANNLVGVVANTFDAAITDSPALLDTTNSAILSVTASVSASPSRQKQLVVTLFDSTNAQLGTFTTPDLTTTPASYSSGAITITHNSTQVDGWYIRVGVTESGGMADSVTVQLDYLQAEVDYNLAPATVTATKYTNLNSLSQIPSVVSTNTISPTVYTNPNNVSLSPTVDGGDKTLTPTLHISTNTLDQNATITASFTASATIYNNTNTTTLTPTVIPGAVIISPTVAINENILTPPSVSSLFIATSNKYTNNGSYFTQVVSNEKTTRIIIT